MNILKKLIVSITILLISSSVFASNFFGTDGKKLENIENRSVISIWPPCTAGIDPTIPEKVKSCGKRFFNIYNPNITVYLPEKSNGTAVILCAGGGYQYIATGIEGEPVAKKLIESGITVFVLKYRLPTTTGANFKHPVPLSDALRAIQLTRYYADRFHVDPDKIGIMGFSAGGHLAASAATLFDSYHFGNDSISMASARPDFMCLMYPVITIQPGQSHGCIWSLLKNKEDPLTIEELSNERNVTSKTPPAFIVHARDDKSVNIQNSIFMYDSLKEHHVPSVLKLYEQGGHGFGMGRQGTDSEQWIAEFVEWLHKMNLILKKN